jgi:hypothetical protein
MPGEFTVISETCSLLIEISRIELETKLSQTLQPDSKEREMRNHSKMESQHLRLRRTKIKLADFRTVKVIGKGAFGEVRLSTVFMDT